MKPIDNININVLNVEIQPTAAPNVAGPGGQGAAPGRIPDNVLQGLDRAGQAFGAFRAVGEFSQLQDANTLARDAFSRIQNPNISPAERLLADTEMERASQMRQGVARQVGGSKGMEILADDAYQRFGFEVAANSKGFTGKLIGDSMGAAADRDLTKVGHQILESGEHMWGNWCQIKSCDDQQLGPPRSQGPWGYRPCPPAPWSATNQGNGQGTIDLGNYSLKLNKGDSSFTLTNKHTGAETRVWGDPHVSEDGKSWTFKNNTSFRLADGTEITVKTKPAGNGQTLSDELDITKGSQSLKVTGLAQNDKDPLTITEGFNGYQLAASNLGDPVVQESGKTWLGADGKVVNDQYSQQHNL